MLDIQFVQKSRTLSTTLKSVLDANYQQDLSLPTISPLKNYE
jgi:hypothetical protein